MICPYCKETILEGAIKCRHCGSVLNVNTTTNKTDDTSGMSADEIRVFVGPNAHYYAQTFSNFSRAGTEKFCMTWNWSCFGFTFLWLLYRKMYVQSLLTFIVFWIPGLNIILHIFAGIIGNYLYYLHAKEKIMGIRAAQSTPYLKPALQDVGGVNKWVITAGILIGIIITILITIFFSTMIAFMGQHLDKITI
jgi:hypothetical protein